MNKNAQQNPNISPFPSGWLNLSFAEQIELLLPVVVPPTLQAIAEMGTLRDDGKEIVALDLGSVLACNCVQLRLSHLVRMPLDMGMVDFVIGPFGQVYFDQALWAVVHCQGYDQVNGTGLFPFNQEQMRDAAILALTDRLETLPSAALLEQRVKAQEQHTREGLLTGNRAMLATLRAETPDEIRETLIRLRLSGMNGKVVQALVPSARVRIPHPPLSGVAPLSHVTKQVFQA